MDEMLMGAIAVASLVAGLFFFRFWRSSRDTFFLFFALSFWIEAANRVALTVLFGSEFEPVFYLVRIVAYGLIVVAILQKNRKRS
ncbi:hypothetical protein EZ313_22800 [Ramlibacter henchirensis]|uniref:Uncharacterized protein n=1 Tax=Ramlibacter henchirensis TaxID=204072 RepID=A0A4Z0BJ70_9BURK|nr:DUF5985 family protein [Ramlibacter henchirensis]TFY99382.1 hypothetical protein EZ313_22800 [Ramlibacter henchirensis]